MSFPIIPRSRLLLPVHLEINTAGSSGLMDVSWRIKRKVRIYRVRIGNTSRQFSEAAFYVEGADKVSRTVDAGYCIPPHDVWMWEGIVEGKRFSFQVKAVTNDTAFARIWYEEVD